MYFVQGTRIFFIQSWILESDSTGRPHLKTNSKYWFLKIIVTGEASLIKIKQQVTGIENYINLEGLIDKNQTASTGTWKE